MTTHLERSDIETVLHRTDIAAYIGTHVALRKRGNDLVGLCPFHSEKTPSFHVHPDRGFFKCFGCGEAGDVIDFALRATRMTFSEAIHHLADRAGIALGSSKAWRRPPPPTVSAVRRELEREEARYREQQGLDAAAVRLIADDLDEIRRRVSVRLGVTIPPVRRSASDSFAGGHERDPLWPLLLERGWCAAWIATTGSPAIYPVDEFARLGRAGAAALEIAERRAVTGLREITTERRFGGARRVS